jgi:hypothetical protein
MHACIRCRRRSSWTMQCISLIDGESLVHIIPHVLAPLPPSLHEYSLYPPQVDSVPLTSILIVKARCARPIFKPPPGLLETARACGGGGCSEGRSRMGGGGRESGACGGETSGAQVELSTKTWEAS